MIEIEFADSDRDNILIQNNQLYHHKTCWFNFTTCNVWCSQDPVNPSTSHRVIMVHACDDPSNWGYHLFWYAWVIAIFHANVQYREKAMIGKQSTSFGYIGYSLAYLNETLIQSSNLLIAILVSTSIAETSYSLTYLMQAWYKCTNHLIRYARLIETSYSLAYFMQAWYRCNNLLIPVPGNARLAQASYSLVYPMQA